MEEENKNTLMDVLLRIPKLSFALIFSGFIYLLISIIQFGFQFYDKSQLISNIAIGGSIFVLAYIYWYFRRTDGKIVEINQDFQSFDKKLSDLEYTLIRLKNKE